MEGSETAGAALGSATSVGSSAGLFRSPEETHAEQSRRVNADAATRELRTEELGTEGTDGISDIVVR
jgi:hypothetical protein